MNAPWFKKLNEYTSLCEDYEKKIGKAISANPALSSELDSMLSFQRIATIYESNLIEEAGLPKEATRKIIESIMPQFPNDPRAYSAVNASDMIQGLDKKLTSENIRLVAQEISSFKQSKKSEFAGAINSLTFKGKNRKQEEVARHFLALEYIQSHAVNQYLCYIFYDYLNLNRSSPDFSETEDDIETFQALKTIASSPIAENAVKELHEILASGLLPDDSQVKAGEYRIDERGVGDHTVKFPSPDLIQDCMKQWVTSTNQTIHDVRNGNLSVYIAAAKISHSLVWIHPFPDFNGRMSRLLMNWALIVCGKPISVDLRGQREGKHKYITALKHANRGKYDSLAALIARRRCEIMENLWTNISMTGLIQ